MCNGFASLWGIAHWWPGQALQLCHTMASSACSRGLKSWQAAKGFRAAQLHSRWKKAPGQAVFPNHSPLGHLHQGLLFPCLIPFGYKMSGEGSGIVFFTWFLFAAPEGVLAHCNCFSLFFCHLWMFPWHSCPEALRPSCQPWRHLHLAEHNEQWREDFVRAWDIRILQRKSMLRDSISSIHRLKILAESSRKAGKTLGRTSWLWPCRGWPAGLSVWLCSYNKLAAQLCGANKHQWNMLESTNCSCVHAVSFPKLCPFHQHLRHVSALTVTVVTSGI